MPEGNTNDISNEPAQLHNETGSNNISTNNNDVLEHISSSIENLTKGIESTNKDINFLTSSTASNHIQITNVKSDVKTLSSKVKVLTHVTHQNIIKIINDINELKATQTKNLQTEIDKGENLKDKSNNISDNVEEKDNKKSNTKKGLMSKVARMVTAMLPSKLTKQQSTHKTNSKLDEKVYNVKISSFSTVANNQLINNLKQVLKIKKQKESFVTKSNMLKLAILAFTGMLIYLLFQIKEVREAFSGWIQGIKNNIISIKDSIIDFFNKRIEDLNNIFITPLSNTINSLVETCTTLYNSVSEPIKTVFASFGDLKDGLIKAWKSIKNISSADIMKLFRVAFTKLKLAINEFLGWNVFKIEQEQPQSETTDEPTPKSEDTSTNLTVNPQSNSQEKGDNDKSKTPPIKIDGNTITNKNTAINTQQNTLKEGDTITGGSILKLQNGTTFNLHKNDDIYIANKPGGVIHGIFQEINSNYSNVKTIFTDNFKSIISNIENQSNSFNLLIDKLNVRETSQLTPDITTSIAQLQNQINILSSKTQDAPTTFNGVSIMRRNCRAKII